MTEIPRHDSMRGHFSYHLAKQMETDDKIRVITADLGYGQWDYIKDTYPDRFFNTGAAEQAAMGIAVGMALSGLKPFIYSISSFLLKRPFETIDLYINHENIPVRLVGGGLDDDYKHDGPSHHFFELAEFMRYNFPNINYYQPRQKEEVEDLVKGMVENDVPSMIALRR